MFNIFRKKTQIEKAIEADGIEHASNRIAEIVSRKISSREVAYRFILEDLDAASSGNSISKQFAANSGIQVRNISGRL